MSEIQTVKTAIHEITHAKLHALDQPEPEPKWKLVMVSEGGTTHDYRTGFESEVDALAAAEADDWRYVDENRFEWRLEVTEDLSEIQAQKKTATPRRLRQRALPTRSVNGMASKPLIIPSDTLPVGPPIRRQRS